MFSRMCRLKGYLLKILAFIQKLCILCWKNSQPSVYTACCHTVSVTWFIYIPFWEPRFVCHGFWWFCSFALSILGPMALDYYGISRTFYVCIFAHVDYDIFEHRGTRWSIMFWFVHGLLEYFALKHWNFSLLVRGWRLQRICNKWT